MQTILEIKMFNFLNKLAGFLLGGVIGIVIGIPAKLIENFSIFYSKEDVIINSIMAIITSPISIPLLTLRGILVGLGEGLGVGVTSGVENGLIFALTDIPRQLFEFEHGYFAINWVYPKVAERAQKTFKDLEQALNCQEEINFETRFKQIRSLQKDIRKCYSIERNASPGISILNQLALTKNVGNEHAVDLLNTAYINKLHESVKALLKLGENCLSEQDSGKLQSTLTMLSAQIALLYWEFIYTNQAGIEMHVRIANMKAFIELQQQVEELRTKAHHTPRPADTKTILNALNANNSKVPPVQEIKKVETPKTFRDSNHLTSIKQFMNSFIGFFAKPNVNGTNNEYKDNDSAAKCNLR